MAGSNFYNLATQFSASASRLRANINSVIEKYDRRFEDDDLISLASMSVSKLSAHGTLKKIKYCHGFGESHLKTTKRKDELLKLKLGLKENNVDLNVSRAIERECVDALANLNEVGANEPSDAETLSSFDEDDLDDDDRDENSWFENSVPGDDINKNSDNDSDDGHLSGSDIHCQEDSYSREEDSYSSEDNLDSSDSDVDDINVEERNSKVVKNTTVTIVISSDSEDEVDGMFALKDKTYSSQNQTFNCTYVLHSPNEKSQFQHENENERIQDESQLVKEHNVSNSTFVSISSPRPKVKNFESNHRKLSNFRNFPSHCIDNTEIPNSRVNFGNSAPNLKLSGWRQTCATYKRKQANVEEIRYDGLFKSPQGLKLKRIAPVFIGPASNPNPAGQSPKHSSHTSGISSCSSLGQVEGNTVHPRLTISNEFKKPAAQTHYRSSVQRVQSNLDSTGQTKARRVDQWVDMVNMNSTMSKEPLHYPSCPPKIPKHFCPKVPGEAHSSCFQKPSNPHSPFLDKHKDIGIQTTLNCTVRCAKTKSPPRRVMRDVSTILSNSFLDAHSPGRIPVAAAKKVDDGFRHNQAVVDDENIMFPEDYVYKFCPLNPNRIDSDDSANLHQNECFRQGLKCFRPRRNVKRGFEEEIPNEVFSSPRNAKVIKLDNTVESFPHNTGPRDFSFTAVNSPSRVKCNGTFVVDATQTTNFPKTIACCNHRCSNVTKPLNEAVGQGQAQTVSKVGAMSTNKKFVNAGQRLFSKENYIRASTPIHLENNNYRDHSCDFVCSSFSDICIDKGCGNNESWVSPKIGVFLNSSRQHSGSNNGVCFLPEKDFDQNNFETSLNSSCSDVPLENPTSFLSPVKVKEYNSTFSHKGNKMLNSFQTSFANNDGFTGKDLRNSSVTSLGVSGDKGHGCKQMNNAPDTSARNDTTFGGKSPKENKNGSTPCFSLHDFVIEGDLDKTGSGSFVDAHTPKAKVLRPSPRKVVLSGKSYLTDHKIDNLTRSGENRADSQAIENHPTRITPHALRQKSPFQKELMFEGPKIPCLNISRKEKCDNAKKTMIDSDSLSTVEDGHKNYPRCSWEVDKDRPFTRVNRKNSHNYGGTVEHNLDLSSVMDGTNKQMLPDVLPHSSKMNNSSDSLSTINGSNEFEECDGDNSFDSQSQIQNSGAKSTNKHFPSNSSKQTHAHQQHFNSYFTNHTILLSKNAKQESADCKRHVNSTLSQNQLKDKRKWKNSLPESKAHNSHLTECDRRFHRASTPVEQSRRIPPIPLNTSMSTIVGPQDEEEDSDCYDEDWDTKLMEDVDIL